MIKVTIVEDIKSIREGLSALINMTPEFSSTESYDSCESMLKEIENTTPDVILMDINLLGMSGIEGVKKVKKRSQILILSCSLFTKTTKAFLKP